MTVSLLSKNIYERNQIIKYFLIFIGYFLFCTLIMDKGLDLTDNGFHLANQMIASKSGLNYIAFIPIFWLSDVLASQISNLFGGWTLIEMREIVLLEIFIQLILILKIQKKLNISLTFLETLLFLLLGIFMTIPLGFIFISNDYYTLPTFLSYIIFYYSIILSNNLTNTRVIILSILYLTMLNLRITTGIVILFIPILNELFKRFTSKNPIINTKEIIFLYFIILVLLIIEFLYFSTQKDIINTILVADWYIKAAYPFKIIVENYIKDFFTEISKSVWLLYGVVLYMVNSIRILLTSNHQKFKIILLIKICLKNLKILPYFLSVSWIVTLIIAPPNEALTNIISLSYLLYILLFIIILINKFKIPSTHSVLIISGGIIPIALFIGTNTGLNKIGYGLSILIFTNYCIILSFPERIKKSLIFLFFCFYLTFLGYIIVKGKDRCYENIMISSTDEMSYKMQNGKIKGTYTRPNTGKAIDELLFQIAKLTNKEDRIFTFLAIPLIYYAADRHNIINNLPNFDILQPPKVIHNKLSNLCLNQDYTPKILVQTKKIVYDINWETDINNAKNMPTDDDNGSWNIAKNSAIIKNIVEHNCRPIPIWENDYFVILSPQIIE